MVLPQIRKQNEVLWSVNKMVSPSLKKNMLLENASIYLYNFGGGEGFNIDTR